MNDFDTNSQDPFDNDDRFAPSTDDYVPLPDEPSEVDDDGEAAVDDVAAAPDAFAFDNLAAEMAAFTEELEPPLADVADDDDMLWDEEISTDAEDIVDEPEPIRIAPADEMTEAGDIDVDLALAAVSGLDEMIEQREAEARAEEDRLAAELEAEEQQLAQQAAEDARVDDLLHNPLPMPGALTLRRGSIASLSPGVVLVGVGIWLTVAYTTGSAPTPATVAVALVAIVGVALLSTWLSSGRWNRGALFLVLWGVLSAGVGWYVTTSVGVYALAPALIAAFGLAFVLSALLARPVSLTFAAPGLVLMVVGAVMLAFTLGVIPSIVVNTLATGWIVVAVVCGVILLLPLLRRLRR